MSTATLTQPIPVDTRGAHAHPPLGRLVAVELRKIVNTRAGFWLQIAMVVLTVVVVIARCVTGGAADHTFVAVLDIGLQPTAVLLPVVGVLLVTAEWSQRTGLITFVLVPKRSRILVAKLAASLILATAMFLMALATVAAGVLAASHGGSGVWTDAVPLSGQAAVFVITGMITGVAFGAIFLASAPALVVLFAVPIAWAALTSLAFFANAAPWIDTLRALGPLHQEVIDATQWAHVVTALGLWMLLPLIVGIWRITRTEVTA